MLDVGGLGMHIECAWSESEAGEAEVEAKVGPAAWECRILEVCTKFPAGWVLCFKFSSEVPSGALC